MNSSVLPAQNTIASGRLRPAWVALALFVAAFLLNSFGRDWGLPNDAPRQADAIEGMEIVNHWPSLWRGAWAHRYPRIPFILNAIFYKPLLDRWAREPIRVRRSDGPQMRIAILTVPRITLLMQISRTLSALMGAGIVVAVFLLARRMFRDGLAAVLAALCAMLCRDLTLYSHWGTVDIQATFWFAWSLYFAWRAMETRKWRHCLLLGLCVGLAVCSKEPLGAYAIGLALGMGVFLTVKSRAEGLRWPRSMSWVADRRFLAAVGLSLLLFAIVNNAVTEPAAFLARMRLWTGHTGEVEWNAAYAGQLDLLIKSCGDVYSEMGGALFLAALVGVVYGVRRYRQSAPFAVLPLLVFYLIVITRIRYTYPRFYLPGLLGLFPLAGKALADLARSRRIPRVVSLAAAGLVLSLSLAYCLAAILEMKCDTRARAEQWFVEHVPPRTRVAALTSPVYAPQLAIHGFYYSRGREAEKQASTAVKALEEMPALPSYVVSVGNDDAFEAAICEQLGYRRVALFERIFLAPNRAILDIAGWPVSERQSAISPRVVILGRI